MTRIIKYFIEQKVLLWMCILALILGTILSLFSIRRENFPKVDFHQARITTVFPGASAGDVEQRVTIPIEEELREIEGLKKIRSISRQSVSEINVQVDLDEPEPDKILEDIRRVLDSVPDLPAEVSNKPVFTEIKSGTFPVLEISLYDSGNENELYEQARYYENQLEKIPGVAKIIVFGERDREWQILVNPVKLARFNVSLLDVTKALSGQNVDVPGGVLESGSATNIRTSGIFNSINELGVLPVNTNDIGAMVRLHQVATFLDTYERPRFLARTDGKQAVILQVLKKENSDVLTLVDSVKERLQELKKNSPVKAVIVNDYSRQTRRQLDVVSTNAVIGLGLVVAILLTFLNTRIALLTSLSLPLVLGATLMLFPYNNISFNMVSMMGMIIALGMLVDNSIVIAENVYRFREEGLAPVEAAIRGSSELVTPIIGSFLTTAAAFLPMMFMSGIMGKFIWQIPFVVILVLTVSLLESFFLLPARMAHYGGDLSTKKTGNALRRVVDNSFESLTRAFTSLITKVVHHPFITLSAISVVMLVSLFGMSMMKFSLFPKEEVEQFLVKLEFDPSARISQTMDQSSLAESLIRELPNSELVSYSMKGGIQQKDPNDPLQRVGEHLSMIQVFLTPEVTRQRSAKKIIDTLEPRIQQIPGLKSLEIEELIPSPPIGIAVTASIEGPDYKTLRVISAEIQHLLNNTEGVFNVNDDYRDGRDEIVVKLKQEKAALVGVSTELVAMMVRTAFEGTEVSTMRKGIDEITLRVLYDEQYRSQIDMLKNLPIPNRVGLQTSLANISSFETIKTPESLSHYNFERSVVVTASVDEKIITSNDANALVLKFYESIQKKYPGYQIVLRGEQEETAESMASLAKAGLFAIFAIFAILAVIFSDIRRPVLILATVPLGIPGIVIGFLLSAKALSFLAMIGIIGLAGVQVNASIMLITFIDQLIQEKMELKDALIQAAKTRFRPILLTTLTTMGGLFPTAYSLGGSDPMLIPITLALAWGLGFGTFGSLIFIPSIMSAMQNIIMKFRTKLA